MAQTYKHMWKRLRQLIANWDVDSYQGRLIFADWLEEQGEEKLAAYTRYAVGRFDHDLECLGCFRIDYGEAIAKLILVNLAKERTDDKEESQSTAE